MMSFLSASWRKCNWIHISNCSLNVRLQYEQCNVIHSTFQHRLHRTVIEYDAHTLKFYLSLSHSHTPLTRPIICITSKSTIVLSSISMLALVKDRLSIVSKANFSSHPIHSVSFIYLWLDSSSILLHGSFESVSLNDNIQMPHRLYSQSQMHFPIERKSY